MCSLTSDYPSLPIQPSYEDILPQYELSRLVVESNRNPQENQGLAALGALKPSFIELVDDAVQTKTNVRINELLKGEIGKSAAALNAEMGIKKLSLIHIAVITFNNELLSSLCDNPLVDINKQDSENWTGLHHAALVGNNVAINILKTRGANETLRNVYSGTYQHIIGLTTAPTVRENDPVPLIRQVDPDHLVSMTVKDFFQDTNAIWLHDSYVSKTVLQSRWRYPRLSGREVSKQDAITLPTYRLGSASSYDIKCGFGLFAIADIPMGSHVGFYDGLQFDDLPQNETCFEDGTNSLLARNSLTEVNDGFPNIKVSRKIHNGLERIEMTALENITAGTQLLFNYGDCHKVKRKGPYVELRPKEARDFLKHMLQSESIECLFSLWYAPELNVAENAIKTKLQYIFQTPAVLQAMLLDGTIDYTKHGEKLIKNLWFLFRLGHISRLSPELGELAIDCCKVIDGLKPSNPQAAETYREWLLSLPSQMEIEKVKAKMTESAAQLAEAMKTGANPHDLCIALRLSQQASSASDA